MAKNYTQIYISVMLTALLFVISVHLSYACNEQVCASIVSKCMLTQSCKCDLKNCSCCKECFKCLGHLSAECCSCVEMCPKPTESRNFSRQSHVEELEGVPGLFDALTADTGDEDDDKWSIITFPVDFHIFGGKRENPIFYSKSIDQNLDINTKSRENIATYNCTVAYMSQCLSSNKCKQNCESMGASSFRWFYDGCCECVGSTCINYGISESRCKKCPDVKVTDMMEELQLTDDDLDFGENYL